MLLKPDIPDELLLAALQDRFDITTAGITFLPLGADRNTAVYRVVATDGTPYFLKLRFGEFNEIAVTVPGALHDLGVSQVLAPVRDEIGALWVSLGDCRLILYPFLQGQNGYEVEMSPDQWRDLGSALKSIHSLDLPEKIASSIPRESYSPRWRDAIKTILAAGESTGLPADPLSAELSDFLKVKSGQILDLVRRAQRLASLVQSRSPEAVLCHADIHAGNVLIDAAGEVTIVDWDAPIFAPKERDLMFFGAGLWGSWRAAQEEETLFYEGYGATQVDPDAVAYYRYERIIEDIAAFVDEICSPDLGSEDREQSLRYLKSNFLPGSTIELAYQSDPTKGHSPPDYSL